jgi:hypothetical protein
MGTTTTLNANPATATLMGLEVKFVKSEADNVHASKTMLERIVTDVLMDSTSSPTAYVRSLLLPSFLRHAIIFYELKIHKPK